MSINGLNVTSAASARYWSELKDLSNTEKIELIALLSSSMIFSLRQRKVIRDCPLITYEIVDLK